MVINDMNLQIVSVVEEQSLVVEEINCNVVVICDVIELLLSQVEELVQVSQLLNCLVNYQQGLMEQFKV